VIGPSLRAIEGDLGSEIRVAAAAPRFALGTRAIAIGTLAVIAVWLAITAVQAADPAPGIALAVGSAVCLLIWAVAATAIARVTAVALARGERIPGSRAVAFGVRAAPTCLVAWLYGAGAAAIPAGLAFGGGWLAGLLGRGVAIAWWCVPGAILLGAATCAVVACAFALVLVPPAASMDAPFAFDLFARTVSYLRHRPGRAAVLACTALASTLIAATGFACALAIGLSLLHAGTGISGIGWPGVPLLAGRGSALPWYAWLFDPDGGPAGPLGLVTALAPAMGMGYFLASVAAGLTVVYAALRRAVDAIPLGGILPGEEEALAPEK